MEVCGYVTVDPADTRFIPTGDSVVNRVVECCVVDNI
jgi:hypothetical protein